jgi:hypothetical protein
MSELGGNEALSSLFFGKLQSLMQGILKDVCARAGEGKEVGVREAVRSLWQYYRSVEASSKGLEGWGAVKVEIVKDFGCSEVGKEEFDRVCAEVAAL